MLINTNLEKSTLNIGFISLTDCAPLVVASTLGIGAWKKETVSSMVLSVNGNAITVSNKLYHELQAQDNNFDKRRPVTADTLKCVIEERKSQGKKPLTFAHVFPTSTHNYFLRYWLASAGIDPDKQPGARGPFR